MSFIEKNKAWLLPLLGLGILGVGYMNFRTIKGDAPPAENQAVAPQPAPVTGNQGAVSPQAPPTPAPESAVSGEAQQDLWTDLRSFAVLPGNLAQEGALKDRARVALGAELDAESPLTLGNPSGNSLETPTHQTEGQGSAMLSTSSVLPELEFVIHGPEGSSAWFGGHAYRAGEKLPVDGYSVSRIGPTFVELNGPTGKTLKYTNPFHDNSLNDNSLNDNSLNSNAKNPSSPAETP